MLKRFIPYYKKHLKLFSIDLSCAFLIALLDLIFPMLTRKLLKDTLINGHVKTLYLFVAVLSILYILKYLLNYIVNYWGHIVGLRIQYDMRRDIFSHIQTLPVTYFDNNKTGHIMSRIVNDLRQISELAHHGPEDLFISLIMLTGSFIMLCTISPKLTLIIFALIPFLILFASIKRIKMTSAFRAVRKEIADINAQIENSISGIRVSKSFTNEDYERKKFKEKNDKFKSSRKLAYKCMAEFMSGINFFTDILNIVVLGAGGYFVIVGEIQTADLVAYLLYIVYFFQPIKKLTNFIEQYQSAMTGFERFLEVMDTHSEKDKCKNLITPEKIGGHIEFKNVSFSYSENAEILSGINLKVHQGQTLALVGPSGSGKTTLCHLLPRFYEISQGEIIIDDKNIKNLPLKYLRKNIGIVQQDVFLFAGTIKENISYGKKNSSHSEIIAAAKQANIHHFINSLEKGYDTYVGERGIKLSGGQKQRISIARIFLKNPPILILDEATSSLDNESEAIIQESLDTLSKGRTTIVVAHRLSTIKNAHNIVVLTADGIVEQGTHAELLSADGIYKSLYEIQFNTSGSA